MVAAWAEATKRYGILSCKTERLARFYKYLGTFAKPQVSITASATL
jgi:hypothetical protein